jgi:hypothetical protein
MAQTPAERTAQWRMDQRRAGNRPTTIHLPVEERGRLDAIAYRRHQSRARCIIDLMNIYEAQENRTLAIRLDSRQLTALEQKIAALATEQATATILMQLAALGIGVQAPAPPEPPAALPPLEPPPPGMKYCQKNHAYPTTKRECPQCARDRKRRHRQAQAQKRAGTIPTP